MARSPTSSRVSTTPPKTWDEFIADAKALKAANIDPILIGGGADTLGARWLFEPHVANEVYAKNPEIIAQLISGQVNFSDPNFVTALNRMVEIAPYASKAGLSMGYADAQSAFLAGKAGMYSMGSWFAAAPDKTQAEGIGVFALPTVAGPL